MHSVVRTSASPYTRVKIVHLVLSARRRPSLRRAIICARAPFPFSLPDAGGIEGDRFPNVRLADLNAQAGREEEIDDEEEAEERELGSWLMTPLQREAKIGRGYSQDKADEEEEDEQAGVHLGGGEMVAGVQTTTRGTPGA